jgi:hypothetical protein
MSGLGLRGYFEARRRWANIFGAIPTPWLMSNTEDPKAWRPKAQIGPSCYMPHQGARECARRRRQMGLPE